MMKGTGFLKGFKGGFTLIELLIVVAIIAILAAIAVPNFLEAQVRSKVSRALADMRTIKTGLESYAVDNNSYILSCCPLNSANIGLYGTGPGGRVPPEETWVNYTGLTTPVSYMTTIPKDPFSDFQDPCWYGGDGKSPFHYYSGNGAKYSNNAAYRNKARMMYLLVSSGPDQKLNLTVDATHSDAYMLYFRARDNKGGKGWDNATPYDTTNGTRSAGDIYMFNTSQNEVNEYFSY